ncbi:hypothetical protein B0H11DRAFT_2353213 [Mycena galericulata]|nr:hypothetical protein B0H11DRAFT_2353213 [Mycena galericulata]
MAGSVAKTVEKYTLAFLLLKNTSAVRITFIAKHIPRVRIQDHWIRRYGGSQVYFRAERRFCVEEIESVLYSEVGLRLDREHVNHNGATGSANMNTAPKIDVSIELLWEGQNFEFDDESEGGGDDDYSTVRLVKRGSEELDVYEADVETASTGSATKRARIDAADSPPTSSTPSKLSGEESAVSHEHELRRRMENIVAAAGFPPI